MALYNSWSISTLRAPWVSGRSPVALYNSWSISTLRATWVSGGPSPVALYNSWSITTLIIFGGFPRARARRSAMAAPVPLVVVSWW